MSGSSEHSGEWRGDNPYFLVIRRYWTEQGYSEELGRNTVAHKSESTVIDLDTSWVSEHAELMREPGAWMLCSKRLSSQQGILVPLIVKQVEEGEQPFYAKRHIGVIGMSGPGVESVSHGIGVKQRDGRVDGMFILPNGSITTDDDVYWVGDRMNKGQL